MRGVQRVLNNIINYTGAVDTYAHACICTYSAENLEGSASARAVPVLRHEFVWSFKGAQMPRSAALQMFEQKFRPFTILYGAATMWTERQPWTNMRKDDKADRAGNGRCRRDMKGSQVAGPDEDDDELWWNCV